jgi:hypothetical protein
MENVTMEMVVLAVMGMVIHVGMLVMKRSNKKTSKFSLKIWLSDMMNWWRIILAVTSTAALLIMSKDIASWFGINLEGQSGTMNIVAFASGYFNHYLIRKLLKMFKKKVGDAEEG